MSDEKTDKEVLSILKDIKSNVEWIKIIGMWVIIFLYLIWLRGCEAGVVG